MNTAHLVKKAQQRLFFLRKLKRAGLSPQLLTNKLLQGHNREHPLPQCSSVVWQLYSTVGQKGLSPGGEKSTGDCGKSSSRPGLNITLAGSTRRPDILLPTLPTREMDCLYPFHLENSKNGHEVTKPTVEVLPPSPKECRNKKDPSRKKKTLVCVASKFYPDHVSVSWKVNEDNVTEGVATDNAASALRKGKTYTITSRLRVSAKEWYNPGNKFTCTVAFYNGTNTVDVSDSISGDEAPDTGGTMSREKYLKITQSAKLSYGVFIAKSCIYGAFVAFLVWKIQKSQKTVLIRLLRRLIKHPGEEALINCSHSNTNFDMIQWYKQSPGKNDMALIGYVHNFTSVQ
ncbi:hypothetical protein L3Q82_008114 [Scortum barcoo]|uniref:Uncharacterized protein n=1 Tax=Scortum barcoo TaxID=214431 RepID=A0ACB8WHZ6_9TELE|nr:hypothetical protein L3Q82_008114 [Scortum barcoo]